VYKVEYLVQWSACSHTVIKIIPSKGLGVQVVFNTNGGSVVSKCSQRPWIEQNGWAMNIAMSRCCAGQASQGMYLANILMACNL
jgi:hypothetical protein